MGRRLTVVLGVGAAVGAAIQAPGCAVARRPAGMPLAAEPAPAIDAPRTILGRSVEGRPIYAHVLGTGDETILLIATIHGNESAGTPLLQRPD